MYNFHTPRDMNCCNLKQLKKFCCKKLPEGLTAARQLLAKDGDQAEKNSAS